VMVYDFDQRRDIAVLKIRANGLQTVTLGDSGKLVPGDKAYAIGNPEGYDYTVSDGLISARRVIDGTEKLQITVPISHGSSGGPLYNDHGEVVGITTEGIMEGAQLLNFAVPVKYLAPMLDSLPRNLTLAQVTAQTQPPAPASPAPSTSGGIGTIIGNKYTERTGQITVTLAEGWQPQPPPNGELMEITKGNGLLVLLSRNANVEANFQTGMDVAKKVFTDITPFSNVVQKRRWRPPTESAELYRIRLREAPNEDSGCLHHQLHRQVGLCWLHRSDRRG
jgi:S1-C subfamily serine protease